MKDSLCLVSKVQKVKQRVYRTPIFEKSLWVQCGHMINVRWGYRRLVINSLASAKFKGRKSMTQCPGPSCIFSKAILCNTTMIVYGQGSSTLVLYGLRRCRLSSGQIYGFPSP